MKKITKRIFRTRTRALIAVLSVVIVGVWALVFTQASTQNNVQFVLFCPTDSCLYQSDLNAPADYIPKWYNREVGKPFNIAGGPQLVRGSHDTAYYRSGGSSHPLDNALPKIQDELTNNYSANTKVTILLGFDARDPNKSEYCGIGYVGGNFNINDRTACGGTYYDSLAHELGHNFGLDHVASDTLMRADGGSKAANLDATHLDPAQAQTLRDSSQWFQADAAPPPPPSNPAPEGSIYTGDDDSAPYACQYQSGWAIDKSDKNQKIAVHVYVDNGSPNPLPSGESNPQGISAGNKQGDPNFTNIYGTDDTHGWAWNVPSSLKDGRSHKVEFFVIDYPTNSAGNHSIGVRTINCAAPPQVSSGNGTGLMGVYYDNLDFTSYKFNRTDARIFNDWGGSSPDSRIGADTFSTKWLGQVQATTGGTYTFYTTTDDGVRLYVNNQLLINQWKDQGPTEYSGTISLTAGQKYDIRMEYYEQCCGAVAKLSWLAPGGTKGEIPTTQLYPYTGDVVPPGPPTSLRANGATTSNSVPLTWTAPTGEAPARYQLFRNGTLINSNVTSVSYTDSSLAASTSYSYFVRAVDAAGNLSDNSNTLSATTQAASSGGGTGTTGTGSGLLGVYYDDVNFTSYKFSRVDGQVNFNYGSGSPDSRIGVDTFSMSWLGQVQAIDSGSYTFYVKADDGVRLYVAGKLLVDKFIDQGATEYASATVNLTAGQKYYIRMEYYENGYDASAQLSWAGPNIAKQVIPTSQLYPSLPSGIKQIIGLQSPNKCLDLRAGQVSNAVIQLYGCQSNNNNQLWSLEAQSDGRYVIKSMVNNGYCLDVPNNTDANGTGVWMYGCNGTEAQRWAFVGSTIRSGRGKCLDARGPSNDDQTVIQIWDCTGPNQTNQLWR